MADAPKRKRRRKRREEPPAAAASAAPTGAPDMSSADALEASVVRLKKNKRVAKRRKAQVSSTTFAGPTAAHAGASEREGPRPSKGAGGVTRETEIARKRCRDAQASAVLASAERMAAPSEARSDDLQVIDGSGCVYPVESMSTFREVMGSHRRRANEQVVREEKAQRGSVEDQAWGVVGRSEMTKMGGVGSAESTSLQDYLRQETVQDRWGEMAQRDGAADGRVTPWRNEMLNQIPVEFRERMCKVFDERQGGLEAVPPPVSQSYVKDFLRSPFASRSERPCAAGRACQGVAMYQRSFRHAASGDSLRGRTQELVLREYLSPAENADFQERGALPWQRRLCVVCDRWAVTMMAKCTDVRNADINMNMYKGQQGACPVMTGMPGGYDVTRCVYGETPDKGVLQMHVQHADNLYVPHPRQSADGTNFVEWEEVNVAHREGSLN